MNTIEVLYQKPATEILTEQPPWRRFLVHSILSVIAGAAMIDLVTNVVRGVIRGYNYGSLTFLIFCIGVILNTHEQIYGELWKLTLEDDGIVMQRRKKAKRIPWSKIGSVVTDVPRHSTRPIRKICLFSPEGVRLAEFDFPGVDAAYATILHRVALETRRPSASVANESNFEKAGIRSMSRFLRKAFAVAAAITFFYGIYAHFQESALRREGVWTNAVVDRQYLKRENMALHNYATYSYHDNTGARHEKTIQIDQHAVPKYSEGTTIRIVYHPDDPTRHRREKEPNNILSLTTVFAILFLLAIPGSRYFESFLCSVIHMPDPV